MAKSRYRNRRRESGLAREYTDPLEVLYNDSNKVRDVYEEVVQKELENGSTGVAYNTTIHHQAANILVDMCCKYDQRATISKVCILVNSTHAIGNSWQKI